MPFFLHNNVDHRLSLCAATKKAKKGFLPIQPGHAPDTWAKVDDRVRH